MRTSSSRFLAVAALSLCLAACTNGGKNQRDTTGMTPAGAATGATTGAASGAMPAAADSITSRRDTLGGRMRGMMPRTGRDTTRRRP